MQLKLNYDLLKSWKAIVGTSFVITIFYLAIIYLHPENLSWVNSEYFSFSNLLWFVFVDQAMIECVSVLIIFGLIRFYASKLGLTELTLQVKNLIIYELKFLPLFLIAYFFFAPVSLSLRYLLHHLPTFDSTIYFAEYFYSLKTYINYLPFVLLVGYTILNVNLLRQYNVQLGRTHQDLESARKPKIKDRLFASDEFGELFLEVKEIMWIERKDRKTFAFTSSQNYRMKENITSLEGLLDPNKFVRINRSVIVNLDYVLNYSFWEHDKYVLRMREQDREFVMSRARLNKIKSRMRGVVQTDG